MNEYFVPIVFENSRPYFFSCPDDNLNKGDKVVVETIRGLEIGVVDKKPELVSELKSDLDLKPIIRVATKNDIERYEENLKLSISSILFAKKAIEDLHLDMNLLKVQYTLDRSKAIFIYSSEDRVDFRELLKILATQFKCRIELRQIGARDRAKMVGGIGVCGLNLCCTSFLDNFDAITINMAKNQFLVLNIQKLSGQCGKLMCCLRYEDEEYTEIRKSLPKIGSRITYNSEQYKITNINVLTNQIRLENASNIMVAPLEDIVEIVKKGQ